MKISEIYEKYKIMPNLREHMFRVAGVALVICENSKEKVDENAVVAACLLHDTGNILKFRMDAFPKFLEPEGLDYWLKAQNEFREKYGDDEHDATYAIAREIGVNKKCLRLLSIVGFSKAEKNYRDDSLEKKICSYSDCRVGPFGVLSLWGRLEEARKRYLQTAQSAKSNREFFERLANFMNEIEKQIFAKSRIKPEDINDGNVFPKIAELRNFEIIQAV